MCFRPPLETNVSYVQGFVAAVPTANRQAYLEHARAALPLFKDGAAVRMVETWGDDVPPGTRNDFQGAVQATPEETVVFSWMEYTDRGARDAAMARIMADPRMRQMPEMPFDGKRLIFGGFDPFVDIGEGRGTYVDGYLLPVPAANRDAYRTMAQKVGEVLVDYGALRVVEAWGDDVPDGKVTDFRRATLAQEDEGVVFAWVEWPSKQVRDAAWAKSVEDPRMKPEGPMPFDGKRMIYGGFETLLDD